jgi:uncharacterized protein
VATGSGNLRTRLGYIAHRQGNEAMVHAHRALLFAGLLAVATPTMAGAGPVIDMHVHAYALDLPPGTPACPGDQPVVFAPLDPREELDFSTLGDCPKPMLAPKDEDALMRGSIAALRQHDVRLAMTEGSLRRPFDRRAAQAAR